MLDKKDIQILREGPVFIFFGVLILATLIFIYQEGLSYMVEMWDAKEEYGHGYIIPFITLFLIWQKSDKLELMTFKGSWAGLIVVIFGLILFYMGELSSIYTVIQYAFIIALFGVILSVMGGSAFKIIFVPLIILLFMIPLPNFILHNLSSQLQLISSLIGVAVIRLFDISVYLEGNVIDLGVYKLQVVEACSGLNYLFPLMTLAFISAYFFTGTIWKKSIIFLSSIPITILMNSFRIGAIGVTVEYWGPEMAEGFLHDFEGWVVFMSCIAILIGEMWLLAQVGKDKLPLREAFGLDFPAITPKDTKIVYRDIPKPFYASLGVILIVAVSVFALPDQVEIEPERKQYAEFPLEFDGWQGSAGYLEQIYIDVLKLNDYVMNDYQGEDGGAVNFYSAYYSSQKKGASAHSPRSCIPGGGWRIASLTQHSIEGAEISGVLLEVNRLVIQKDETRQLVYYWFQQRGRIITNEYMMKWWLFWDSMNMHRTDGALMRLVTILKPGQDISIADKRLQDFSRKISPIIPEFIPGK
ncbi:MAG: VPLPA-CTERM-specific exosortase XrtD [endosymbiont of Galathealinum brachiosum]|uniref:VPLPA-CTERM-specific exosortase XrtD n=1 Tax=endosymbiont of Galathealinum brachiosum TaxID=2200906 RepID=A0A370D9V4_9GAMM|nr:MAG: VPLPA-CTERM-specific exosortase XrtD [endosymbiont of Galathealinum brachiosum]